MLFLTCQLAVWKRFAPIQQEQSAEQIWVTPISAIRNPTKSRLRLTLPALLLITLIFGPSRAWSQNLLSSEPSGSQYPSQNYYLGLQAYRSGDLDSASDLFESALRSARRDINGRWIDSIPALAMLAECHWHLGSLQTAHQYLDQSFEIAIRSRGWLGRIDWQSISIPGAPAARPNLWAQAQAVRVLPLNRQLRYRSGELLTEARLAQGGVIEEPSIRSIDAVEIMRGFAIASYRRRILLGRLAENDPRSIGLLESTKYPQALNSPIPRSLISCVRATGYFAAADDQRAVSNASQSAMPGGNVHPLSAIVMLAHGSAIAGTDKPTDAVAGLVSAIHIAGALDQPEWIGEAIQLAAGCASQQDAAGVAEVAALVSEALERTSALASLHGWIAGSDAAVTAGDLDAAKTMLGRARTLASRRKLKLPRLEAYASYIAARIAAAEGSSTGIRTATAVDDALQRVDDFALNHRYRKRSLVSMPRIYQLNLVLQAVGNSLGNQTGDALLTSYIDDSPVEVWRRDPVDAYAGVIADRSRIHQARVTLAAAQGYGEQMLVTTDRLLGDRFNSRLPFGGRLSQIRSLARARETELDKEAVAMRQLAGPLMKQLQNSIAAAGPTDQQRIESLESLATRIGLGRSQFPTVMPPPLKAKLPVAKLPPGSGMLTFVQIGNQMYGMLAFDGKVAMWNIAGSGRVAAEVGRLLRAIGVAKTRGSRFSDQQSWRTAAATLRDHLIPDDQAIDPKQLDELIVVPDGPLWYVPFELFPISDEENSELLGDRITVRYAPTPGLALNGVRSANASRAIGIANGPFFAPKDAELNQAIAESIKDGIKEPVDLSGGQPSGWLGQSIGHFVVAAPRTAISNQQLMMVLSPYDEAVEQGTLAAWMRFPAIVPRSAVLVGLRTTVDGGQMGDGTELFVTLCALNAAGVENVLLSRWAVGGESTAMLLGELLQELPFIGMNESWRRAKMVLRRSELDPEAEPLLSKADRQLDGLTGDQPLFWSGYLVSAPGANPSSNDSTSAVAADSDAAE